MRSAVCIGLLTLALGGCGPSIHTTTLRSYPSLSANSRVAVFSVKIPDCRFEELGLVTIREQWGSTGDELLIELKAEARRMGGNALVGLHAVPKTEKETRGLSATVARLGDPTCMSGSV